MRLEVATQELRAIPFAGHHVPDLHLVELTAGPPHTARALQRYVARLSSHTATVADLSSAFMEAVRAAGIRYDQAEESTRMSFGR